MADLDDRFYPPVFGLMAQAILLALDGNTRTSTEIACATGLHASTVIRIAAILRDLKLVDAKLEGDTLRIGPPCP